MLSRQPSLRERVVDAVFPPATKDSDVNLVRVFTILLCVVYVLVAALIGFAIWELVFSKVRAESLRVLKADADRPLLPHSGGTAFHRVDSVRVVCVYSYCERARGP